MVKVKSVPIPRGRYEINRDWCKGCKLCTNVCPKGLLSLDETGKVLVTKPEECIRCGKCENVCPDYAIRVIKDE